jgi:peptide/nickel transport system permease protein
VAIHVVSRSGATALARGAGTRTKIARAFRRDPVGVASAVSLLLIVVLSYGAPLFTRYSPYILGGHRLVGPSLTHLAGTDQFGRDVFTRVLYGGRASLTVGFFAGFLGSVGALVLALAFTYAGGAWDYAWMRVVDTFMALPGLVLLLVLVTMVGPSVLTISIILGLRSAITGTRVMRSVILSTKTEDYVLAAASLGANPWRIAFRHIVPNVMAVAIVTGTLQLGGYIIAEASLSFLGLGIRAPTPSWGGMMGVDGRSYIIQAPWMLIAPAILLCLTVLTTNMVGDWLRDRHDPRLRGAAGMRKLST